MIYLLDPSKQESAIQLVTRLEDSMSTVSLNICTSVLKSLRQGEFGSCPTHVAHYEVACRERFPYAQAFRSPSATTTASASSPVTSSGATLQDKENYISN